MKILLVHNPLSWHPLYWFSLLIRMFRCTRYNHGEIVVDGVLWGSVAEGVRNRDYEEWLQESPRIILPLEVDLEALGMTKEEVLQRIYFSDPYKYGFSEILKYFWHEIVRYRWAGKERKWDGLTKWQGMFCFHWIAWLFKQENPERFTGEELKLMRGVTIGQEFKAGFKA